MIRSTSYALLAALLAATVAAQDPGKPGKEPPPENPPAEKPGQEKADKEKQEQDPGKGGSGEAKPGTGSGGSGKKDGSGSGGKDGTGTGGVRTERIDRPIGQDPKQEPEPLPASADPADLRAMRSARQMLEAEKRLAELIKKGELEDIDRIVTFEELSGWPYEDGLKGLPERVGGLDGKTVIMTGFMLPIEEVENIREFLLVQSLWACCFGQPPDINGIVRVVMKGKQRVDYQFDPIKVVGKFKVQAAYEDGYCVDIYQLEAESVEVIR